MSKKSSIFFPDDWPLDQRTLGELGRIPVLFSTLENLLSMCVTKLAGSQLPFDPQISILITHSNFSQKIHMFEALCEFLKERHPNLKNYKDVSKKLRKATELRNQFMHGGVFFDEEAGVLRTLSVSARGKLKTSSAPVSIEKITGVSVEIHDATLALYELVFGRKIAPKYTRRTIT